MTKYLLTNEVIASNLLKLLVTNPAYSEDVSTSFRVATNPECTHFKLNPKTLVYPTPQFPDITLAKKGWGTDVPLNGVFPYGTWTFKIRLEGESSDGFKVKVSVRLSKAVNSDGSNAILIGIITSPNVLTLPAGTGVSVIDSFTWSAPDVTIEGMYLFAEYSVHIEQKSFDSFAFGYFVCDEDPSTADESIDVPTLDTSSVLDAFGFTESISLTKLVIVNDYLGFKDFIPQEAVGNIFVDSVIVGGFTTFQIGATGFVFADSESVGTFNFLSLNGTVYVDSFNVGTYVLVPIQIRAVWDYLGFTEEIQRTIIPKPPVYKYVDDKLGISDAVYLLPIKVVTDKIGITDTVLASYKLIIKLDKVGLTDIASPTNWGTLREVNDGIGMVDSTVVYLPLWVDRMTLAIDIGGIIVPISWKRIQLER